MKKIIYIIIAIYLFANSLPCQSQTKLTEEREQVWLGYFAQTRFTNKLGMWTDFHYRSTDNFVKNSSMIITHNGFSYYFNDNTRIMAGYAFAYFFAENGLPGRNEHRPWQQIWWRQNYSWFQTLQWIRLEERFRQRVQNGDAIDSYNFNYRIRYNLALFIPLKGKKMEAKTPFFTISDEIFINFGKEIVYNYFDNNRFFVGFGYQFTKHLNAQLGYMNVFQQQASGNQYVDTHAIRLFVFQTFDLRAQEDLKH